MDASEIKCPKLSMLLTGTFNQYRALVPSVENGYFSRLMTMVVRGTHPFDRRYVSAPMTQSAVPTIVGNKLLRIYETLAQGEEQEWSLTDAQKERLGTHLETEYGTLIELLGENFHSAIIRMAIQIERIAMILTAMRIDAGLNPALIDEGLFCCDEDYETAELIGNKMLLHMAQAYRMIDGEAQELVPEMKPLDQKKVLFEQLKSEFEYKHLIEEAKRNGISRRTVERWNNTWQETGLVEKLSHGLYKKTA